MNCLRDEDGNIILSVVEQVLSSFDSDIMEDVARHGVDSFVERRMLDILIDMRRMDLYHDTIKKLREHCEHSNRI